jgi:ubiquinone/menaquinone biosynthesis C-methylase UbiE
MALPSYAMNQSSFPKMYERWLVGPLFRPWAELTLEELDFAPRDRVLDIACGTGIVARVAKEWLGGTGFVVGVDVSSDMLAVARAVSPDIDWRQGDAVALPLREGELFDVVVCQQGLQFFSDKAGAIAEMRCAVARGGRLAVATWCSDDEIPFFRELRSVAERHIGPIFDQRYNFGDVAPLLALLKKSGFHDIRVKTVSRIIRFDDGAPFLRLNAMALVGMSAIGKDMNEQDRLRFVETIVGDSVPVLRRYTDASGLTFELSANLATAMG